MESKFVDISASGVEQLRATDPAIIRIKAASVKISFGWLRESFKRNNEIKDSLQYGTAILSDVAQLDQYLYTYGKMIEAQWHHVLKNTILSGDRTRLVDYGCGQGIAGLLLYDKFGDALSAKVDEVLLIEPSKTALIRAEAVYRKIFPKASITCLNLTSTQLDRKYFSETSATTAHIFSNVLDIPGFDQSHTFNSTLSAGKHVILAVSHNRDFAGGAGRLRAIKEEMEKKKYSKWVKFASSELEEFTCGDGGKFSAISWTAALDISRE